MTYVRRLKIVGALLALAAVISTTHVWGEPGGQSLKKRRPGTEKLASDNSDETFAEDLANSKFAGSNLVTYKTTAGDTLFALQVKPQIPVAGERPCDYLVMVDTSASQAKGP